MSRISKNDYYMTIAQAVSQRSTCLKRRYGAVIVKNDEIIATGYNGSPRGTANCCDIHEVCPRANVAHNSGNYAGCPAVHAEQNAIISAISAYKTELNQCDTAVTQAMMDYIRDEYGFEGAVAEKIYEIQTHLCGSIFFTV